MPTETKYIALVWRRFSDYLKLLKPRVMSLVVFTALVGLLLAPGSINIIPGLVSILAIALGAGAAGAINMWYDRDIDSVMERTQHRPLPAGRLHHIEALFLGILLSIGSIVLLTLSANITAALLLAVTILYYVFIYTIWLKRRTPQNVVIGGVSGALPPVIGWSAVTGSIELGAIFLFTVIFLWTPPHSWALAIFKQKDYSAAAVPMLPIAAGGKSTGQHILIYSVLLVAISLLPLPIRMSGLIYGLTAICLGIGFLVHVWRLFQALSKPLNKDSNVDVVLARKLFVYSVRYLFLIFLSLLVDQWFYLPIGA